MWELAMSDNPLVKTTYFIIFCIFRKCQRLKPYEIEHV